MELDKISSLPGHIIDQILSQLPIKDAVRTSVLSSKWRYRWAKIPHLVFDNKCVSVPSEDQTFGKNKLTHIIDHVLLLHNGPIQKFKLSHRDLIGICDVDRWILYLSRSTIREFVLEIWKGQRYKLPSCLFSFENLIHLELFNCLLKPPSTFKGFRSLKSLDLQHITLAPDAFENLISSCPLLEKLTLMNFDGFTHLKIDAPNLQFFDIGGVFEYISFESTFQLSLVSVGLYANKNARNVSLEAIKWHSFFTDLPHVRRLEIQCFFLKYLADGGAPRMLPKPCLDLNYLSLRINFNDREENSAALCILRSSPNLLELELLVRSEEQNAVEELTYGWVQDHWKCHLEHLRLVKIVGISGVRYELDFIRFMLLSSPALERMTIKPASSDGGWDLMKELLRFRRASVQAEIVYMDP
ncbi:F-box/FBD/LRR-repeat protein At1g13570-like isoform X2 [Tripterygium wilfordii]|nr:F-box/FBD/LRR-repeat protein At1g13570-like isoform X2 [Tripterygium wilfordii]